MSVLQGADDKPLLILSREGKGRVAELLTDQTWLWARGFQGGGPHVDLTRRLAHWLMKEPDTGGRGVARPRARPPDPHRAPDAEGCDWSGAADDAVGRGARCGADARKSQYARASVEADELGLHKVQSGDLTRLVSVGVENPREFHDVVSSTEPLRALVEPAAEPSAGWRRRAKAPSPHHASPACATAPSMAGRIGSACAAQMLMSCAPSGP